MDLQKQKAEKTARNQVAKKIAQQAKASAKAKAKTESTSSKKRKTSSGAAASTGAPLPELQEIASLPPEQQVAALQAKLDQEKELDSLISSCSAHLKLPSKLPITKLTLADKMKGTSKAKVLEDELQKTKAAAAQAAASGQAKGSKTERDQDDECAEFGFKAWKDNASSFAGVACRVSHRFLTMIFQTE
eukprot:Skav215465  [mRNA]  locus=scaffold1089:275535:276101:- [translate_table: standard]